MPSQTSDSNSKTLIICVDRDDDIGTRTGIKSPIIGKDACLNAATKLALADPEEADANALFAAVQQYHTLISKGNDCEVVAVTGLYEKGIDADKKIRREISEILHGYHASEAVLVSDGIEGEEIAPIIQSLVPIVSIRKVIVKHSRSVEESYMVLGRYLRMLVYDPRYSKVGLGIPGLIVIGFVIVYAVVRSVAIAGIAFVVLIGLALIIRGFDVDKKFGALRDLPMTSYLRFFSIIMPVLIIIAGLVVGINQFFLDCAQPAQSAQCQAAAIASQAVKSPEAFVLFLPKLTGYFIEASQILIWLGIGIYIVGSLFFDIVGPESGHIGRWAVSLIVLALLYFPIYYLGNTLVTGVSSVNDFVAIVLFALAVNFVVAAFVYSRITRRRSQATPIEVHGRVGKESQDSGQ